MNLLRAQQRADQPAPVGRNRPSLGLRLAIDRAQHRLLARTTSAMFDLAPQFYRGILLVLSQLLERKCEHIAMNDGMHQT